MYTPTYLPGCGMMCNSLLPFFHQHKGLLAHAGSVTSSVPYMVTDTLSVPQCCSHHLSTPL